MGGDLLWGAGGNNLAAAVTALGAEVENEVGALDHVEVVLDHHHRVALRDQPVEDREELGHVGEVQAGGGLVEDVEGAAGGALGELARQLHPLRLAARQGGGALAELDVAQPHVHQGLEAAAQGGHRGEKVEPLLHGHRQDLADVLAFVANLQGLAVVAQPLALVAGDEDVGEEVHLDAGDPVAAARLAPAALDVEREAAGLVAADARLRDLREQGPDVGEQAGVGGGVGARGPADGRLVDGDHLIHVRQAVDLVARPHRLARVVQVVGEAAPQAVVHQRRLAGAGDTGDTDEAAEGKAGVDALEVVLARAAHGNRRAAPGAPASGDGDGAPAGEEGAGERPLGGEDRGQVARRHHLAAVDPGTRPHVDDEIGGADRLLVVLHHHHRVAEVAQAAEGCQEPVVVALVEADGGLVEDVHHPHQGGADLGGEADPLPLAAGKGGGGAVKGEVAEPHRLQKTQAGVDLLEDLLGDLCRPRRQIQPLKEGDGAGDRQPHHVVDVAPGDPHRQRLRPQAPAVAGRTRVAPHVRLDLLAQPLRLRLAVTHLELRDHPGK